MLQVEAYGTSLMALHLWLIQTYTALQVGGTGKKHPWEDVELGPLIGQGSFGKVYRGVWNGAPVAVKVCKQSAACLAS